MCNGMLLIMPSPVSSFRSSPAGCSGEVGCTCRQTEPHTTVLSPFFMGPEQAESVQGLVRFSPPSSSTAEGRTASSGHPSVLLCGCTIIIMTSDSRTDTTPRMSMSVSLKCNAHETAWKTEPRNGLTTNGGGGQLPHSFVRFGVDGCWKRDSCVHGSNPAGGAIVLGRMENSFLPKTLVVCVSWRFGVRSCRKV